MEEKRRRDEELAILGKLSGDKALTAVSQPLLTQALAASQPRYTEHGVYDPKEGKLRVFPEYQRRLDETRLQGELGRAESAQAAFTGRAEEAERARVFRESEAEKTRLARETLQAQQQAFLAPYKDATARLQDATRNLTDLRARIKAQEEGRGKALTGQPYKDMKKAGEDLDALDLIEKKVTKDFAGGTSQGVTWLGKTQDAIASAVPGFAPDQWVKNRDSWAILQRLQEMKARYALFGATLTGNEKSSWEAVTPPRGLNNEQLKGWFDEQKGLIHRAIANNAESLAQGGFNKEQLETFTRGLYKAPKKNKVMMWDPSKNTFVEVEE
jgi:hypothetical protein